MKCHTASVIVYINEPVVQQRSETVSESLRKLCGVSCAEISRRIRSMVLVDYDPMSIDSQRILQCVKDQGCSAVLVGM
jgi:hypothetical protein